MWDLTIEEICIACCIWIIFFLFAKVIPAYRENKYRIDLYKKVGWIAEKENPTRYYPSSVKLRYSDLISHIMEEQGNLDITEEFRIDYKDESEKRLTEEILELFRTEVVKSYFHDTLSKSKLVYKCTPLEYFMYRLYLFIDYNFENYEYKNKIYESREYTDKTHYNCKLTEYGRVCYKLYLITLLFIEKHEETRNLFEHINPKLKNDIMGYLKNNEVSFWSYRP